MVYLLCFDKKFKHAKHYIGFAENENTFKKRLEHHRKGSGSRLMAAIAKAGIGFTVTRTWPDGDRNFERKLKNRKEGPRLCPHCVSIKKAEKMRQRHIAHLKANPISAAHQAVVDELSTPEGFEAAFKVIEEHDAPTENVVDSYLKAKHEVVCPVVETAKKMNDDVFRCTFFDKKPEVANAQPESRSNPSRWQRIWSRLARFLGFS